MHAEYDAAISRAQTGDSRPIDEFTRYTAAGGLEINDAAHTIGNLIQGNEINAQRRKQVLQRRLQRAQTSGGNNTVPTKDPHIEIGSGFVHHLSSNPAPTIFGARPE